MQIYRFRPLALAATLFALTAVLGMRLSSSVKLVLLILSAGLLAASALIRILRRRPSLRLMVTMLCLAAILLSLLSSYLFFNVRYADLQEHIGQTRAAEGYVLERIGSGPFYSYLRVRITDFEGGGAPFDALLEMTYPSTLQVGDGFTATVVPRGYTAEDDFNEQIFRLSNGCLLILTVSDSADCSRTDRTHNGIEILSVKLNQRLSYALRNAIGGEEGGLCAALLLGNRTWLSDDSVLHFRRAGISHLLALSGLHVSILIGFVDFLLKRLRAPYLLRAILIPTLALGYLLLTGCAMSTCRAVLMVCILYFALLSRSRYDSFTAICTVLALILLVTPYAVYDLSLWMSFLAAASIIVFSPALTKWMETSVLLSKLPRLIAKLVGALASALFVGFVANLALMLLSASVFGELSLASIPATLALSVPITLTLICSAAVLILPALPLLPQICASLANLHLEVAQYFSDFEWVMLPANDGYTQIPLTAITLALVLLAVCRVRRPLRLLSTLFPCLLILVILVSTAVTHHSPRYDEQKTLLTTYFGNIEIYTEHGEAVVINRARNNISEAHAIKNAAKEGRATDVDHLIYPRYYNQSTFFLARLCANIRVETLHLPSPETDRERAIAARIAEEAELHGVEVAYDAAYWLARYDDRE